MSTPTIILVLRSLFPFLKEIILKDKDLRELLLENKLATFLAGALLVLFCLFLHMTFVASDALNSVKALTEEKGRTGESQTSLQTKLDLYQNFLTQNNLLDEDGNLMGMPSCTPSPKPTTPTEQPSKSTTKNRVENTLRNYAEGRLQKIN